MTQDPFEEFEFKPITDGLGFHGKKKKAQIMASVDDNGTMTPSIPPKDTSAYSLPVVERPILDPAVKTPKVDQVLEQIKSQRQSLQIEERKKVTGAKADTKATVTQRVKTRIPSRPEVTAMMLDFLLCISGFLTVLILTILTTQVDLVKFLTTVPWQEWVPFLYMTVAFTAFIYTTVTRLFSRQTVGEWVTDQYIEVKSPSFAVFFLRVVVRDFLVVATGFVLLPLLSLLLGTDLAGRVSGAYLVKETYV